MLAYLHRELKWKGPTLLVTSPGREHPEAADLFDHEEPIPWKEKGRCAA